MLKVTVGISWIYGEYGCDHKRIEMYRLEADWSINRRRRHSDGGRAHTTFRMQINSLDF